MVELSVVIATYNRGSRLLRTLRSLVGQTLPADKWEVVVVNNNSTDDTAALFADFAAANPGLSLRLTDESRQGLSRARNRGIVEARGAIIVMIDDDEEVLPDFLGAYYDFFATRPGALAAGGKMVAGYEEGRPLWMSHYTEALAASTIDLGNRERRFPRGRYPIGGNMAFRREVFERFGMFDTALGRTGSALLGGEEKELFGRMATVGGEVWWVPRAAVLHIIPASRLTEAHFRKLSRMVGATARILSRPAIGSGYLQAIAAETVKWIATLTLSLWFVASGRPAKARYLIIMRRCISAGLLEL